MTTTPNRLSPDEVAKLLHSHHGMIWDIAHKLHAKNPSVSLDDLHAHVQLGFVRAASKFDPSRGWQFSTYAYPSGWREGLLYCRLERAGGMHVPENHPFHFQQNIPWNSDLDRGAGGKRPEAAVMTEDFWDNVTRGMISRDRVVFLKVLREFKTYDEIAPEFGCSKQRVQQMFARAMEKVKGRAKELESYLEAA